MMTSTPTRFRRICVLTGDHHLPDATKLGSSYGDLDLQYHQAMREALQSLVDYDFEFLSDHSQFLQQMLSDPPDFVLNLCDTGFRNVANHELHIPALLELLSIPYSGATPACMVLCYDKNLVRLAADSLGIVTPREWFVPHDQNLPSIDQFEFPALIKPNRADGSVGITRDSVVHDAADAKSYVERLRRTLPNCDVLVQEYLPGPEYGMALIGNPRNGFATLPPLAVDYSQLPADLPPILGYESKTDPESAYWRGAKIVPAALAPELEQQMHRDAEQLFERLQCQDYARFDWRARADGKIALMEVNPNPAWDPEAKLAFMVSFAGKPYSQVFQMILRAARARLASG